jgi:hypothetical protein
MKLTRVRICETASFIEANYTTGPPSHALGRCLRNHFGADARKS